MDDSIGYWKRVVAFPAQGHGIGLEGKGRTKQVQKFYRLFLVPGMGHCGKGCAVRARGLGANVIVTEVKPTAALKAMERDPAARYQSAREMALDLRRFLEPTPGAYFFSLDTSFGYVQIAALGAVQMDVKVNGRSVHSGMSHLGETPSRKPARC
jgi:hypothetical protein